MVAQLSNLYRVGSGVGFSWNMASAVGIGIDWPRTRASRIGRARGLWPLRALLRIQVQRVGVKKRAGSGASVSKMGDNKDSSALLGASKVFRVKHPVGPPIPAFRQ